jgi:hypothetical protein
VFKEKCMVAASGRRHVRIDRGGRNADGEKGASRSPTLDPVVQAGRLKVEVMAWYVEKGYMSFKPFEGP